MASTGGTPRWNNPFHRDTPSPTSLTSNGAGRPKSAIFSSPLSPSPGHGRNQSLTSLGPASPGGWSPRPRSNSRTHTGSASNTFAPQFITAEEPRPTPDSVQGIEGENDFSGKRFVWLKDPEAAFVRGWVVEQLDGGRLLVQCDDESQREVEADTVDKVNPAKFDKAGDMAELTHLNEASVVHNLRARYQSDLIYTYSGLFLVAVNPYSPLPIYTNDYINMYKGRSREETKPHIYAMADEAFRNLVDEGENQSVLVTGESGAGKTENTKKVIQYLAAVANTNASGGKTGGRPFTNLSQQILRANPILESFGNAQTVRNHNSSRFGKFIRIEFTRDGHIAGAFIDWYLLEKSRVVRLNANERNYHIFYQLLRGADRQMKQAFFLDEQGVEDFVYTKEGNDTIAGVSDRDEWDSLIEAFKVMGFSTAEQRAILRTIAAVLHLGNIGVQKESLRADQAQLTGDARRHAEKVCQLLGIAIDPFIQGLLHPRVKAGREWVEKVQTPEQVRLSIDALAKGIYERGFGDLVSRINRQLDRTGMGLDDSHFIGVLDIAGFEIFEENSFEQLCINYTNEKLQQFFNHHMFVLEQEEYAREQIEWKFIDFGKDLQPTIDLIELPNPIGIFSCLDEDSVMPKATDRSFTEKLHALWDRKTPKYRRSRLANGFMLTHYAAEVEYSTDGWLEKNKDPLNDNLTRLLAGSTDPHLASLFADCMDPDESVSSAKSRVKRGLFRTVAQRHKEQLGRLMHQLHSTHPHFVRCIIPNHRKKPKQFSATLVLDQLRCNGVLEGIRIARTGFPNRLPFTEFRQRYEVLCKKMPSGYLEGQQAAQMMLTELDLDRALYRVGLTKVFFRAGVLAELEEQRDALIRQIVARFQSVARGFSQRRLAHKRLYRAEAARIIQRNVQVYLDLCDSPWWRLLVQMKPLLGATRTSGEIKKREETIQRLEQAIKSDAAEKQRLDEDRRRADAEIQRIQHTLESERALALDKDEIFRRLQEREAELSDKLAGALADQEGIEDQLEHVLTAKRKVEEKAEGWRRQLEQAGQLIARLEGEKHALSDERTELQARLDHVARDHSAIDGVREQLGQEIGLLQSQLSLKARKVQDLEQKLRDGDEDLTLRLADTTRNLEGSRRQIQALVEENRQTRQQLSELSATSTGYEDLMRRKESELAILRADVQRLETDRKRLSEERQELAGRSDDVQARLRQTHAEMEAMQSQRRQLEREAADAKKLLDAKISEEAKSGEGRRMLDQQITDLKAQLFEVQTQLSRERQSRDDVSMLGAHEIETLRHDYDTLNESKITIEKEMYVQQDTLRRAQESRATAEQERKTMQQELRKLRERYTELEQSRVQTETALEQRLSRQAAERQATLRRELETQEQQREESERERGRLAAEVQRVSRMLVESDGFRVHHDQHKERLERELVTVKGRLTASENDNRALLNKIQQKNLDIARSHTRASDGQRAKLTALQADRAKAEADRARLQTQLEQAHVTITSLEKQKEKLSLSLEDLTHEIAQEHKTSRNAGKASSTVSVQLAEAQRTLETERRLKSQAQAQARQAQTRLAQAERELQESRGQLLRLQKVFDPNTDPDTTVPWESRRAPLATTIDLAQQLERAQAELRVAAEKSQRAEAQLAELRRRHQDELSDVDHRHLSSKRNLLEELDQNNLSIARSPKHFGRGNEVKVSSNASTPTPTRRQMSNMTHAAQDSGRSDRSVDTATYQKKMEASAELEMIQNQVQMLEMQNRHLQSQLSRASPARDGWADDSPTVRRVQRLERENSRLHEKLDDSAQKVSALERSLQVGELSLRDVQTRSHEELFDLLHAQEQSRRSLRQAHDGSVTDLAEAKTRFEEVKRAKASLEVELRDVRAECDEVTHAREQEAAGRSQLLQDSADLQIRLDAESSKVADLSASVNLYKGRADEYFNKLEQAEIAVLKASRAESFAKTQARDAEDQSAGLMAERKQMDAMVDDLQRQSQLYEEKIEDMSADLEGALQAKKRLQHELEDYRSQRAMDIEDKETSMEQTRKKYQSELSTLTQELEIERESVMHGRTETTRLREELEELRSKWDDEVLNSSTWAKEKARLDLTLQDLAATRDEAVTAHHEAQSKVVSLLSQVRTLRTSVDDVTAERDLLLKEKRGLEARLSEAGDRLEDLARGDSPSMRNAAGMDRALLELKTQLAQQEDVAAAAVEKMRRAEALALEMQKDMVTERESSTQLHREKVGLEKGIKDLQLKLVDLETKSYSSGSQDVRFLHGRVQELEQQLEAQETERNKSQRSVRNVDRTVRDLKSQLERREKTNTQLTEEISKARDKVERLLHNIEELQASESSTQLQAKRAERELREEREKALRLERELEGWKGLRMERGSLMRTGTLQALGEIGHASEHGSRRGSLEVGRRKTSNGKGFL
ncbi:MAG: hypothetical protein M1838_002329 [Thelocarpon superellum]|nr:MAG: hypothetical protein M1838_002329 [Thelocarpon superellum]